MTSGTDRRTFLFLAGSVALGRFAIPGPSGSASAAEATPSPDTRARRLLALPSWDDDHRFLLWIEETENDDDSGAMMWTPTSARERAEANRFFEAAHWRSWQTPAELQALLSGPGPWLVRWNYLGRFMFVDTADTALLFGTEERESLTGDPAVAARMTSEQAFDIIPRLMTKWEFDTDESIYFEPVSPADAERDLHGERMLALAEAEERAAAARAPKVTTFDIQPLVGALPIRFGMTRVEVRELIGPPENSRARRKNNGSTDYWHEIGLNVGYGAEGAVDHIGFGPGGVRLSILGKPLWTADEQSDPNPPLLRLDPDPVESVGFLIFVKLDMSTTGYHDDDESQRAVTLAPRGVWEKHAADARKPDLSKYRQ